MATLRPSVLILGEGITEFYYFQFLFDLYRRIKIAPDNSFLEKSGGSLRTAIDNADRSVKERTESKRDYTYSELGQLFGRLDQICKSK